MYLAEQLGVNGNSEVGCCLRGGKKFGLSLAKTCFFLVLEEINVKGRGSIWCVEKGLEDDSEIIAPKAKKRKSDADYRQEQVQYRFEALKKTHGKKLPTPSIASGLKH